jgi:hypothetical protein
MARLKVASLIFAFFGILAGSTYFRFEIPSRPLVALQDGVDLLLTSWMGNTGAAIALLTLAVCGAFLTLRKSYEEQAGTVLRITQSTLNGKIYKPTAAELSASNKSVFGKRS